MRLGVGESREYLYPWDDDLLAVLRWRVIMLFRCREEAVGGT